MVNGVIQMTYQCQLSLADGRVYSYSGVQNLTGTGNAALTAAAAAAGTDLSTQMIASVTGVVAQQNADLSSS